MAGSSAHERVALVTGAGSGIGRATAELLLDSGWNVAFLDISERALGEAKSLHGDRPGTAFLAADVTDEAAVMRAVDEATGRLGTMTGAVNSAGIGLTRGMFETTAKDFRRVLDVNVVGTFLVAQAVARRLRDAGRGGAIVNIASISGLRGSINRTAYGASKGAVVNLTMVMATELAPHGIRVNAVAPGPVETEMVKAHHTALDRNLYARTVPMRRYAEPVEIARAARFLLDPVEASYITGEILAVDGGYRGAGLIDDRA